MHKHGIVKNNHGQESRAPKWTHGQSDTRPEESRPSAGVRRKTCRAAGRAASRTWMLGGGGIGRRRAKAATVWSQGRRCRAGPFLVNISRRPLCNFQGNTDDPRNCKKCVVEPWHQPLSSPSTPRATAHQPSFRDRDRRSPHTGPSQESQSVQAASKAQHTSCKRAANLSK